MNSPIYCTAKTQDNSDFEIPLLWNILHTRDIKHVTKKMREKKVTLQTKLVKMPGFEEFTNETSDFVLYFRKTGLLGTCL